MTIRCQSNIITDKKMTIRCDHDRIFVTLAEFWNLASFTKKSIYMGYIISFGWKGRISQKSR